MTDEMIDITNLPKPAVLAALHNGTRAIGMGSLHDIHRDMTPEEAASCFERGDDATSMFGKFGGSRPMYFDYLYGRPLKVDLLGDSFDPRLYDRDAGQGRAAEVIAKLRQDLGL